LLQTAPYYLTDLMQLSGDLETTFVTSIVSVGHDFNAAFRLMLLPCSVSE